MVDEIIFREKKTFLVFNFFWVFVFQETYQRLGELTLQ